MLHYVPGFRRNDGKRYFSTFYEAVIFDISKLFLVFNCMAYIALFLMKKQELCHSRKACPRPDGERKSSIFGYFGASGFPWSLSRGFPLSWK